MKLVKIDFIFKHKITTIFVCFKQQNFPSWIRIHILNADPDPGGKMNVDPAPQP